MYKLARFFVYIFFCALFFANASARPGWIEYFEITCSKHEKFDLQRKRGHFNAYAKGYVIGHDKEHDRLTYSIMNTAEGAIKGRC